jgi:very-short-patch-repair endonuclease
LHKIENYLTSIHNGLISNKIEFKTDVVLHGIFIDFHLPLSRTAIIITEKEHDHGESYFAEMEEIQHLKSCGFTVVQLPLPNYNTPLEMEENLFRQLRL